MDKVVRARAYVQIPVLPKRVPLWVIMNAVLGAMVAAKRFLVALVLREKFVRWASALPIAHPTSPRNATAANCIGTIPATPKKNWPRIAART